MLVKGPFDISIFGGGGICNLSIGGGYVHMDSTVEGREDQMTIGMGGRQLEQLKNGGSLLRQRKKWEEYTYALKK